MAAMFAGASRALLTSIIFALETTAQSNALLPLLGACLASYLVSFFLMENTIMTEKIARRGVKTPDSYESDMLETLTVEDVIADFGTVIDEESTVREIRESLDPERSPQPKYFLVSSGEGEYKGILSSFDLPDNQQIQENKIGSLLKSSHTPLKLKDTLRKAAETMAQENTDVLAVVEGENIIGILSYRDILATYKQGLENNETRDPHISIKRHGYKILLHGQKWVKSIKRKP